MQEGTQPSPEFVELVRDALTHLYEPAHLVRHPLVGLLGDVLPPLGDQAQSLRLFLLDAVERLQPVGAERASEKARRPYTVLVQRYVAGLSVDEIAAGLHIGPRQFRREHQKGLDALAAYLWSLCRDDAHLAGGSAGADLMAEVEALGVSPSSVSLLELLETTGAAGTTLARHHGASLIISPGPAKRIRCLCDLTLARQAVLLALSALLAHRPQHVCLTAAGSKQEPRVLVSILPPLPSEAADSLEMDLAEARVLMAAQGGTIGPVEAGDRAVEGLQLTFRPESVAHVLVVDDNDRMLRLYERYLMVGRYGVTCANSAQEAEAILRSVTPDAIVLDVMMRDVDGWELLQRLRANPRLRAVPILVVSVLNEPSMAQALGAAAFLRKPVTAEALLTALRRVLSESSQVEQHRAAP